MKRSFNGRVAVVTGAASGIGRALACELAKDGAALALSDIDQDGLAETCSLAANFDAIVRSDRLDVADRAAVADYAEAVAGHFGPRRPGDQQSGVVHGGDLLGMNLVDFQRVIDIDFWGVVNGTKAFLPHLVAAGGNLVNISSLFGLVPVPGQSAYVAAKYAVRGFTESVRMEMLMARLPVTVTCVHPGGVKTAIARNGTSNRGTNRKDRSDFFDTKLARTSAIEAARSILNGAARGAPRVLVGSDARVVHLLASINNRAWQRVVAYGYRRFD